MLDATLLTSKAAGLDIQNVSVQLGANDLFVTVNTRAPWSSSARGWLG